MRDIIEDYVDEIKQAGGIGCFEKRIGGEDTLPSGPTYASDMNTYADMPKESTDDSSAARDSPNYHRKQSYSDFSTQPTTSRGPFDKDYEQPRRSYRSNHESPKDQISINRDKRDREYYSRSPRHVRASERSHKPR